MLLHINKVDLLLLLSCDLGIYVQRMAVHIQSENTDTSAFFYLNQSMMLSLSCMYERAMIFTSTHAN